MQILSKCKIFLPPLLVASQNRHCQQGHRGDNQGRNFNEKTENAEVLLSFSCSLMIIDTRKPYNSTVTKIFGKYMNISKFKLFALILYFYYAYYLSVNTNVLSHDYFYTFKF
jgi:hypothetical protein